MNQLSQYSQCGVCKFKFDVLSDWHCPRCGWTLRSGRTDTHFEDLR